MSAQSHSHSHSHSLQGVDNPRSHASDSRSPRSNQNALESSGNDTRDHRAILLASSSSTMSLDQYHSSSKNNDQIARLSPHSIAGHHGVVDGSARPRFMSAPHCMSDQALSRRHTKNQAPVPVVFPRPPPEISITSLNDGSGGNKATESHDQLGAPATTHQGPSQSHPSLVGSPRQGNSLWSIPASDESRSSALAMRRAMMASNNALGSGHQVQQQQQHSSRNGVPPCGFRSELSLSSQQSVNQRGQRLQQQSTQSHGGEQPPEKRARPLVELLETTPPAQMSSGEQTQPVIPMVTSHPPSTSLVPPAAVLSISPLRQLQSQQPPTVTQLVTALPDLSSSMHLTKVHNPDSQSNHALRSSRFWLLIDSVSPDIKYQAWSVWDMCVVTIHVFNLLFLPLTLAWPCIFAQRGWMMLGHLMDMALMLNAGLQSKRVYHDNFGIRITDPIEIRRDYFKRRGGWVELLGSVPIEVMVVLGTPTFFGFVGGLPCGGLVNGASYLSYQTEQQPRHVFYWSLLRLTRFLAMVPTLIAWQDKPIPKLSVYISRLVKNFLFFLIVAHIDACIMWVLCYQLDTPDAWINTVGLGIDREHGGILDFKTQYVTSYLEAQQVMFFAFRNIKLFAERSYCVIEVIVGALVNGSIFGNISNLLQSMQRTAAFDKKLEKETFRMDYLRKYMRGRGFPPELQKRIRKHNEFEWTRLQGMTEDKLFGDLPSYLQQEVCNWLHLDSLNSMPLFKNCPDDAFKGAIAATMDTVIVQEGFFVYRLGDSGQEACFIREGSVEFVAEDGTVTGQAKKGDYFGEAALFEASYQRPNSVRALTVTELGIVTRHDFDTVLVNFPRVAQFVQRTVEESKARERKLAARAAAQSAMERKLKSPSSRKISSRSSKSTDSHPSPSVAAGSRKTSAVSSVLAESQHHRRSSKQKLATKEGPSGRVGVRSSRGSVVAEIGHSTGVPDAGEGPSRRSPQHMSSNNRRSSSRGNVVDGTKHEAERSPSPQGSQSRPRRSTNAYSATPEDSRSPSEPPSVLTTLSRSRQGSSRPQVVEESELGFAARTGTLGRRG